MVCYAQFLKMDTDEIIWKISSGPKCMVRTSLVAQWLKNPPANTGDMGSIPGLGRSHMPWSN